GRNLNPRRKKNQVRRQENGRAEEAELLSDEREDHVVVRFRDGVTDWDIAESSSAGSARGEGTHGPVGLVCLGLPLARIIGIEEGVDAFLLILLDDLRQMPH